MSCSLKYEESSGQLQEQDVIIIHDLISQGIDAEDVEKLVDAEIFTYSDLMMHKKNLTGIKGLSEVKFNQICEVAEKLVNSTEMEGGSEDKVDDNSKAAEELLTIHDPIEVRLDYDNYEERIAEAVSAMGNSSIIFNLASETILEYAHLKGIFLAIKHSNKQFGRKDTFSLDYFINIDEKEKKKKKKVHDYALKFEK